MVTTKVDNMFYIYVIYFNMEYINIFIYWEVSTWWPTWRFNSVIFFLEHDCLRQYVGLQHEFVLSFFAGCQHFVDNK
jgi:hypothetical protein